MPIGPPDLRKSRLWRELDARLAQPRRLIVAGLVAVAALCGINAARPAPVATRDIWVAAHDLSGGAPLTTGDLRLEPVPSIDVPGGAVPRQSDLTGRLLAAPVRRGEPITDVRLLSPSLLSALDLPGSVAVPVRVADGSAALALVHAGDLVDVIAAADPAAGVPVNGTTVVHDVRVLAISTHLDAATTDAGDSGGLLIVAASPRQAASLAQAATASQLSVAVRRPA